MAPAARARELTQPRLFKTAERKAGVATENAVMAALRSALDADVKASKLVRSPLGDYGVEPYEPPEPEVWSAEEHDASWTGRMRTASRWRSRSSWSCTTACGATRCSACAGRTST
jgi:hypothetical protein